MTAPPRPDGASLRPVSGSVAQIGELLADWLASATEPDPLVIATSGSTGRPKQVALSRGAIVASATATHARLGGPGQWLLALPPTYVAGVQVLARSLLAGTPAAVVDDHADLASAVAAMTGERRYTSLVPTQLVRALDDPTERSALAALDAVLVGGAPLDRVVRDAAEAAGVRVVQTYGMSETAGGCVYDGEPLPGVEVRIADDGRVLLRGPMLFDAYVGDDAATAAAVHDGWFRTDDLGGVDDDGRLHLLGRADDVVLSGGVNVPAAAVAGRLRAHPAVAAAEVVGVPDPTWGECVVAHVVTAAVDGGPDLATLRDWVAEVHPRAWAPRRLHVHPALPMLPNGKPDRVGLRALG